MRPKLPAYARNLNDETPPIYRDVFLGLVDKLDEVVCEVSQTPFGDADRKFYQSLLLRLSADRHMR